MSLVIDTVGSPRLFDFISKGKEIKNNKFVNKHDFVLDNFPKYQGKQEILVEDWIDQPVFQAMPSRDVLNYFQHNILPLIDDSQELIKAKFILNAFIKTWSNAKSPSNLLIWDELLLPSIQSNITLSNGYTLYQAIEPFSRMLYYICVNKEEESGATCMAKH
jgi:hypothetical protein